MELSVELMWGRGLIDETDGVPNTQTYCNLTRSDLLYGPALLFGTIPRKNEIA